MPPQIIRPDQPPPLGVELIPGPLAGPVSVALSGPGGASLKIIGGIPTRYLVALHLFGSLPEELPPHEWMQKRAANALEAADVLMRAWSAPAEKAG